MVSPPEKISPLHDLAIPVDGDGEVELSERLCDSLAQVQAWPDSVTDVVSRLDKLGAVAVIMPTGPGRWLVEGADEGLEEQLRVAIPIDMGAVTSLAHARVVISISGAKAEWVLSSGVALDFSSGAFPVGSTQVSHHHEIGLTIHRTGEESFDLYVFTSRVRSLGQWITRSANEVGYSVV